MMSRVLLHAKIASPCRTSTAICCFDDKNQNAASQHTESIHVKPILPSLSARHSARTCRAPRIDICHWDHCFHWDQSLSDCPAVTITFTGQAPLGLYQNEHVPRRTNPNKHSITCQATSHTPFHALPVSENVAGIGSVTGAGMGAALACHTSRSPAGAACQSQGAAAAGPC